MVELSFFESQLAALKLYERNKHVNVYVQSLESELLLIAHVL